MKVFAQHHLTAEELDELHEGLELGRVTSHLATCTDCRTMVDLDVRLLRALSALPQFEVSADFTTQVLESVGHRVPQAEPALPESETFRARDARKRVWIGATLGSGLVTAGFVWAFANPDAAIGFALPAIRDVTDTMWFSLQGIVANTVEQPWFGSLRDAMASPARALPALALVAAAYTAGLLGLRRLLTRPAHNASW